MGLDGKHRALVIRAGSEHGSGDVGARDVRARRRRRRIATGLAALASAILTAAPASACRLALVLAIDVSSSVDAAEDRLQRQGLAAALRDADVAAAIARSPRPVALHAFEWSGRYDQTPLLPGWLLVSGPADLDLAATAIERSARSRADMPTAMGYALGYAHRLLAAAPECDAMTIDVAGDGENNEGFGPASAYRAWPFDRVTVNALVVMPPDTGANALLPWYAANVLHGPGAFLEVALGYEDYAAAMRRKLLRELSVMVVGTAQAQ